MASSQVPPAHRLSLPNEEVIICSSCGDMRIALKGHTLCPSCSGKVPGNTDATKSSGVQRPKPKKPTQPRKDKTKAVAKTSKAKQESAGRAVLQKTTVRKISKKKTIPKEPKKTTTRKIPEETTVRESVEDQTPYEEPRATKPGLIKDPPRIDRRPRIPPLELQWTLFKDDYHSFAARRALEPVDKDTPVHACDDPKWREPKTPYDPDHIFKNQNAEDVDMS